MGEPIPIKKTLLDETSLSLKTNLNVWVMYFTDEFKIHITGQLSKCSNVISERVSLDSLSEEVLGSLNPPDVILVEGIGEWAMKVTHLQNLKLPFNELEASLIVFGDEADTNALKIALRVGASDFMSYDALFDDILPIFKEIANHKISNRLHGELYLFLNTKGGNGATTLSINTAAALAEEHPNQVLLLDIDTQFGLISEYMDLKPKYTMLDAIDLGELDESALGGLVTRYNDKLHVLGFGRGQGVTATENKDKIHKIIPVLRQFYSYVIVDYSRGIDPTFAQMVSPASKVFLVLQQNYMSLKNAGFLMKSLRFDFGLSNDSIEVVINRFEKGQPITVKDIAATVPNCTLHLIPNDFKVANESANLGKPAVDFKKRSSLSRAINKFCQTIQPENFSAKGWLARLFS